MKVTPDMFPKVIRREVELFLFIKLSKSSIVLLVLNYFMTGYVRHYGDGKPKVFTARAHTYNKTYTDYGE